jgi:hypothetical protein
VAVADVRTSLLTWFCLSILHHADVSCGESLLHAASALYGLRSRVLRRERLCVVDMLLVFHSFVAASSARHIWPPSTLRPSSLTSRHAATAGLRNRVSDCHVLHRLTLAMLLLT